jgi:thiamine-phosphate pyrophosphorylase
MNFPRLYAILDERTAAQNGWEVYDLAQAYLAGGARLLQLRASDVTSGEFLSLCDQMVATGSDVGARVIVNDRADIAVLSGAAGVHLGQSDLPADAVRKHLPTGTLIGLSTHTRRQIADSIEAPIDYVAVGPVYPTSTKDTGYAPVGLELVSYAAELHPRRPIVAIGGMTLENAALVIEAGATTVAVVSDLLRSDPARAVADYLSVLDALEK